MKILSIQAEEDGNSILHKELIENLLKKLGFSPEVKESFDDEHYVNFYIDTDDLKSVWETIRENLVSINEVASSCMIICQGERGWADMLILHHNDPEVELDKL